MKKIIIAVKSKSMASTLKEIFERERFEVVLTTDSGMDLLNIVNDKSIEIDAAIVDVDLEEINGFDALAAIRNNEGTKKLTVMMYSNSKSTEYYEKALDYEASDFFISTSDTPKEIVIKVKMHLGEQKTYLMDISQDSDSVKELLSDIGYKEGFFCPECKNKLQLQLLRDLSMGKNVFRVAFICDSCPFRYSNP